jgi:conjugal transfer pilus assembly protein TraV
MRGSFLVLTCGLMLAGCASMGGNIKGNFICRAPDGICAPTSNIDDQAIAAMKGGTPTSAVAGAVAANVSAPQSAGSLKVVLPARTDRFGRWREERVVYIEPQFAAAREGDSQIAAGGPRPARLSLVELAAGAPAPAAIASAAVATTGKGVTGETFRAEVERRLAAREGPELVELPPPNSMATVSDSVDAVVSAPSLAAQPAPDGN